MPYTYAFYHTQFSEHVIKPNEDQLLIMATDGLWEFMSDEECIDISSRSTNPTSTISDLLTISEERWHAHEIACDDTTVCIVYF